MLYRLIAPFLIIGLTVSQQSATVMSISSTHPGLETTILEDGLILDWTVAQAQFNQDDNGKTQIEIGDFFQDQQPGTLRLPVAGVLIAIPAAEKPALEILQLDAVRLETPASLAQNEVPGGVLYSEAGKVVGGGFSPNPGDVRVESEPIRLESAGILRGVHLARLIFHPVYMEGKSFQFVMHIRVRLYFSASPINETSHLIDDPIVDTVRSMVINPQQVAAIRADAAPVIEVQEAYPADAKVAAIEVDFTGLVSLTRSDLQNAGFPVGAVDPSNLHLTRGNSEVAYQWFGDEDSIFEKHERLQFYAEPRFSRWSRADVYTLWEGEIPGLRMESWPASTTGLPSSAAWIDKLVETNSIYTPDCYCAPIPTGRDGDRWVWADMKRPDSSGESQYNFSIQLPSVDPTQPANLSVWLIGYTDVEENPDHLVKVSVNATELGEVTWEGKSAASASLAIPAGVLQAGDNTVTLTLPGLDGVIIEGAWLDAFSLRYALGTEPGGASLLFTGADTPQAYQISLNSTDGLIGYDVTDPLQPIIMTDLEVAGPNLATVEDPDDSGVHRYWMSTESQVLPPTRLRLLTTLQTGVDFEGVDYLMITPASFAPALRDLVDLRESQGLQVAIEDIQAIYDVFGDGRLDPAAVEAYLANAYNAWQIQPTHILLVGDGTTDPKRYQASSSITYIPPFLADVDPWAGETASDNRFVTLEGEDNLPEMLIGRLPANSTDEVQAMISKIIKYETEPESGSWSGLGSYIADNGDSAGDFPILLESLATQFQGPTLTVQRRYYDPDKNTTKEFQDALERTWNLGSSLMVYAGHASIHQWAAENLFHLEDIPNLANEQRLPVLLELTCFTGSFQVPGFETLDETLLRHPTGGVVAAWGSTGLGISTGHHWLAEGFLANTFSDPDSDLGSATLVGKLNLAAMGFYPDLIDTYTFIGDPATQMFSTHTAFMPLMQR